MAARRYERGRTTGRTVAAGGGETASTAADEWKGRNGRTSLCVHGDRRPRSCGGRGAGRRQPRPATDLRLRRHGAIRAAGDGIRRRRSRSARREQYELVAAALEAEALGRLARGHPQVVPGDVRIVQAEELDRAIRRGRRGAARSQVVPAVRRELRDEIGGAPATARARPSGRAEVREVVEWLRGRSSRSSRGRTTTPSRPRVGSHGGDGGLDGLGLGQEVAGDHRDVGGGSAARNAAFPESLRARSAGRTDAARSEALRAVRR